MKKNNWIDGNWSPASSGANGVSVDPSNAEPIGEFADATRCDAVSAIAVARRAFDAQAWAQSPRLRSDVLRKFADRLEARLPRVAEMLSRENGKPIGQATMEVTLSVSELRYYAGLARTIFGRVLEVEPDSYSMMSREALGVAGIIVPWNAPVILLIRSLAPAMAAGCTSVVKSAPQTALTNAEVFEALAEVEVLPDGIVNMFAETGSDGAQELVSSPDVDVISYTGSTEVGKIIMRSGADTMKRMNLELGGSAPCVLLEDADLDAAVPKLVFAGLFISGQQCVAASRLIAHRSIVDEVAERFRTALSDTVVGRGLEPETQMGPMIDAASRDRILGLIERNQASGEWILKGEAPGGELASGYFVTPSLAKITDAAGDLLHQEIFGPILTLQVFDSDDEAIALANDTEYGLAASVWTQDLARAQHLARRIDSGTVWINKHGQLHVEVETGGYKQSGLGRLHGVEGLAEFMHTKHISWETAP